MKMYNKHLYARYWSKNTSVLQARDETRRHRPSATFDEEIEDLFIEVRNIHCALQSCRKREL